RSAALDTRAFLLSSADTAAKQPATSGTCWYTRMRRWENVMPFKVDRDAPTPISRDARPTFRATTASTMEDWKCTRPDTTRMRFRTHGPLDVRVTFPTEQDKAAWRAAGSPELVPGDGPSTTTYDRGSHLVNPVIGSHEIEWKTIADLPATKHELDRHLRKLWREDLDGGAHGYAAARDFCQYVFVSAWDLFGVPTTPDTRSSLYRILADCPSIRATEGVRDRMGRPGVALTYDGVRLTVDPDTAQLLVFEQLPTADGRGRHAATEYVAYERHGWVNKIGAVPGP
ncbi:hypothetical protein ACFQ07_32875, partial [Actinomadura adrarensis]